MGILVVVTPISRNRMKPNKRFHPVQGRHNNWTLHLQVKLAFVPSQQGGTNKAQRSAGVGVGVGWGLGGLRFTDGLTVALQQPAGRRRHVQQRFFTFHSHHPVRAEPSYCNKRLLSERQRSMKIPLASRRGGCVVGVLGGGFA